MRREGATSSRHSRSARTTDVTSIPSPTSALGLFPLGRYRVTHFWRRLLFILTLIPFWVPLPLPTSWAATYYMAADDPEARATHLGTEVLQKCYTESAG